VPYDPAKHHRRSIRLKEYDYEQPGAYFVTIVTHQRELLFDDSVLRRIAQTMWSRIQSHFAQVTLDEWIVMPNHIHGILVIEDRPEEGKRVTAAGAPSPGSLGIIVGNFKSVTARRINRVRKTPDTLVWQRNYYERVIRNERELAAIRKYIAQNPQNWELDREHPSNANGPKR